MIMVNLNLMVFGVWVFYNYYLSSRGVSIKLTGFARNESRPWRIVCMRCFVFPIRLGSTRIGSVYVRELDFGVSLWQEQRAPRRVCVSVHDVVAQVISKLKRLKIEKTCRPYLAFPVVLAGKSFRIETWLAELILRSAVAAATLRGQAPLRRWQQQQQRLRLPQARA